METKSHHNYHTRDLVIDTNATSNGRVAGKSSQYIVNSTSLVAAILLMTLE
jgi:hypothetical protein